MYQMRSKILILLLLFVSFSGLAGEPVISNKLTQSIQLRETVYITPLEKKDDVKLSSLNYQLINQQNSKLKFFLDETPFVVFDIHDLMIDPSLVDSTIITIEGKELKYKGYCHFFVEGLSSGDNSVKIAFIPLEKKSKMESITLKFKAIESTPYFKNDAIVIGLLLLILAIVFYTSGLPSLKRFYTIFPALLLCYFLPGILNSLNIVSGELSNLYHVSSRYLLPASLILLCLSIDLKGIIKLGPKALIMFFTGTIGIIIGGPIALLLIGSIAPDWLGADAGEIWRGFATIAGSWIGGGANQTAMKEIFETPNSLFSQLLMVDVFIANIWMAVLLYGAGIHEKIDKKFKADSSAIESLKQKMEGFVAKVSRIPSTTDIMIIIGIGIVGTGLAHFLSDAITPYFDSIEDTLKAWKLTSLTSGFFWLIVFATLIGILLSFTKLKNYEGAGASKMGSIFLYILVASIGMHMDFGGILDNPGLFVIGGVWMAIHAIILLVVAKLIKAPFFFVAVGSQANVGGAASAPVVASAFSPSLAPVGVLLAVLGYAVGTVGAIICALLMQAVNIGG
jgi:uncharacterized membrane protein